MSQFSVVENSFTIEKLVQDKTYLVNLLIMVLTWSASSFCFYIIGFYMKYVPGNVFSNIIVSSVADGLSSIAAGLIA